MSRFSAFLRRLASGSNVGGLNRWLAEQNLQKKDVLGITFGNRDGSVPDDKGSAAQGALYLCSMMRRDYNDRF